jgi:hypothetical protein
MTVPVTPADEACAREIHSFQSTLLPVEEVIKRTAALIAARVAEAVKGERERALEEAAQTIRANLGKVGEVAATIVRALQGKAEGGV